MKDSSLGKFEARFESVTAAVLKLLLMIVIAFALLDLISLMYRNVMKQVHGVDSIPDLQLAVQRGFAGVLLVILGLELLETLRNYFTDHHVRLELILVVATIAMGRHVIVLDLEHTSGSVLTGVAALLLALTGGYFLVQRSRRSGPRPQEPE